MKRDGRSDTPKKIETRRQSEEPVEKKGWRGILRKARIGEQAVCIKELRGKVKGTSLEKEWDFLKKANRKGIGPKAIEYSKKKERLVMEFIEGEEFREWIKTAGKKEIRERIPKILQQGWALDKLGIDHGQLSWAPKHILIGKKPVIVDFERASDRRKVKNLSSLFGYLVLNPESAHAKKIRDALRIGKKEIRQLKKSLRQYREKKGEKEYRRLMRIVSS